MDAISRRLLFHIGTVGFCLYLNELVEIYDQVDAVIDFSQTDSPLAIVGALSFRHTQIPLVDLSRRLGFGPSEAGNILVLSSQEGNWALLVDRVEGFCSVTDMKDLSLPPLLRRDGWRCFERISLYQGLPFLCLELTACYGGEHK